MTSLAQYAVDTYGLHAGDLPETLYRAFAEQPFIAWDIETSGLDWLTERVALCQLYAPSLPVAMVRMDRGVPPHLSALLGDPRPRKIFHHAMFDLRFMANAWAVEPRNIACTKIAAKLLFPGEPQEQQLRALLARFAGLHIDKGQQRSNWFAASYSSEQIEYAIQDVIHLPALLQALMAVVAEKGLDDLATRCFAHIPARVRLEVGGFGDVFTY